MSLKAAPLFEDVADAPPEGAAYWVTTSDGLRIRVGFWSPETAKGTVLLFPGRSEYVEKYGRAAQDLYQHGFATLTVDWRGQGLADRMLEDPRVGHVNLFTDYQKDVDAMLQAAAHIGAPGPYFLLAHSMGACVALRSLLQGLPVQAAVFSGPMWGIRIAPTTRPVAWALSWSSGWVGQGHRLPPGTKIDAYVLAEPFQDNMLTTDADMHAYMVRQLEAHPELSLGGPSLIWLREALRECRHLAGRPSPNIPCLAFFGGNERIVDVPRILNRLNSWPGSRLQVIDGAEHEVLMETPSVRARIFEATAAHFSNNIAQDDPARSA